MDSILGVFAFFVALCIISALWVGAILLVIGFIVLLAKLIFWMAYMGAIFIALGIGGYLLVKLCEAGRRFFS